MKELCSDAPNCLKALCAVNKTEARQLKEWMVTWDLSLNFWKHPAVDFMQSFQVLHDIAASSLEFMKQSAAVQDLDPFQVVREYSYFYDQCGEKPVIEAVKDFSSINRTEKYFLPL